MPRGFADAATMAMQKEALRRVKEMQRQARQSLERSDENSEQVPPAFQPDMRQSAPSTGQLQFQQGYQNQRQQQYNPPPFQQRQNAYSPQDILSRFLGGKAGGLGSLGETLQSTITSASQPAAEILNSFGIDGEKLIILMIMWVIFNEHKDNKLLLMALGYLLL